MPDTLPGNARNTRNPKPQIAVICTLVIFGSLTADSIRRTLSATRSFDRLEPYATTDALLQPVGSPHAGHLVEEALSQIARDQPILFVGPHQDQSVASQIYFTVAVLAYPRPVSAVYCREPGKASSDVRRTPPSAGIGGVIFFASNPGPSASGTWITPRLYLSPYQGAVPWESFCR